ncbi:hypothetical protein HGRIS_003312 [Hohenbuehelia grisea]|uniref:Uncharacterized protein n=1 Tax=Hohenbuehelia grisea TaxID=104357 RepID=A0ABR3JFX2_9AGAR
MDIDGSHLHHHVEDCCLGAQRPAQAPDHTGILVAHLHSEHDTAVSLCFLAQLRLISRIPGVWCAGGNDDCSPSSADIAIV